MSRRYQSRQHVRKPIAHPAARTPSRRPWITSTNLSIDLILCLGHISAVTTLVLQHLL